MIPSEEECKKLWNKYQLPVYKRRHAALVARVARWLAAQVKSLPRRQTGKASEKSKTSKAGKTSNTSNTSKTSKTSKSIDIDVQLLVAGALLHDIDKSIPKLPGEQHPDTAVRILREEGMDAVAALVRTHPLHAILEPAICPKTWEEKLLYLADKTVKQEIITVDKRFALWNDERLTKKAQTILDAAYPRVKDLEKEILSSIGLHPDDVAKLT